MKKIITIALIAFSYYALAQERCPKNLSPYYAPEVLSANPTALPDHTCAGGVVHLIPVPDGGNQEYTYTWTSDPPGFTSNLPEPEVQPLVTTVYTVEVSDGSSSVLGTVTVTVDPLPNINLVPVNNSKVRVISAEEISLCPFDSVKLDAGNPGCHYQWNNGSTGRYMKVETSGVAFDQRDYEVTVTNPVTGCSNRSSIIVTFTFADCIYGIEDVSNRKKDVKIYPNPSDDGIFTAEFAGFNGTVSIEIHDAVGQLIKADQINNFESSGYFIDLNNQSPGVYMIKVSDYRSAVVQKLIIR